jgi:Flp pilus assembly protein TadD
VIHELISATATPSQTKKRNASEVDNNAVFSKRLQKTLNSAPRSVDEPWQVEFQCGAE